ncbi:restriction endonuclease subunit S [Nocardia farcinica]|uniref:restriction endonuclease subunit S n=1 Tax=Nocardia farcinica TaxID=37329 RepID=UPI0022B9E3D4|nr:restriction endonuclease subunit S [Nocardia farcinica]MCZ9326665.1 restriction endonuclease subunit S [Nocardia farcinica]
MSRWPVVALKDAAEIVSGGTPKSEIEEYWDGDIPWVTPKDLSDLDGPFISTTPRSITELGLKNSSATLLPANSVLFSSRAPIGHVAINAIAMATNQGFKSLVPKPDVSHAGYLYHWLRANRAYLEGLGNGATFKEVSKAVVAKVEIPLPPIDEQRRIAAILDHADALRAKRREALARLDELTQSIFIDMFGDATTIHTNWPKTALNDILLAIESGRSPTCHARPANDDEYGVLKLGAVTYGRFDPSQNKALPEEVEPDVRHEVKTGDLLFTRKNTADLVGAAALVRKTRAKLLLPDLIFRLRIDPASKMNSAYLQAVLMYPPIRRTVQGLAGGSAGSMPNISKAKLLTVEVPHPPADQQLGYERRIEEIDRLRSVHQSALAALDDLFASLQSRAFRGEL